MTGEALKQTLEQAQEPALAAAREIRVERALSAGRIETPKTGQTRTVDMSAQLAGLLQRLQVYRTREKLRREWLELPPWVFCTEDSTPLDESRVRKAFLRALRGEAAGIPALRPPPHVRVAAPGPGRAHHVRERAARPHGRDDDAPLVRALAPAD